MTKEIHFKPNPALAKEIVSLGGEKLTYCFQCATCSGSCPPARLTPFRVRKVIRQAQLGLKGKGLPSDLIWNCNLCFQCYVRCPRNVDLPGVIRALRNLEVKEGTAPEAVTLTESTLMDSGNIFGMDRSLRKDWIDYTDAEVEIKDKADVIYFVGCTTSYVGRLQGVPHAISSILNHLKEDWTMMEEEECCGHPLLLSGATKRYKEVASANVESVEATGAKRLVTGCPGCYLEFKHEYPKVLGRETKFEVLHTTQLINEAISAGNLEGEKFEGKLTYHDPCELGRIAGIFDLPRNIIKKFASDFLEAKWKGIDSNCCGAGGFVKGVNVDLANGLADRRIEILAKTGAEVIVSACPTCDQTLIESSTRMENPIRVIDIAELVAEQTGLI